MTLHYSCRHCGVNMGKVDRMSIHSEQLGFHKLSDDERQEMIQYHPDGNIHVQAICEDCQEALNRYPDKHEYDFLIH